MDLIKIFRKCFIAICLIFHLLQNIELIMSYLQYRTDQTIDITSITSNKLPAFSFCFREFEFLKSLTQIAKCKFYDNYIYRREHFEEGCDLTESIFSNFDNKTFCVTYFSDLRSGLKKQHFASFSSLDQSIYYVFSRLGADYIAVHSSTTPIATVELIRVKCIAQEFKLQVLNQIFLPPPYETDCKKYESDISNSKSQKDCIFQCLSTLSENINISETYKANVGSLMAFNYVLQKRQFKTQKYVYLKTDNVLKTCLKKCKRDCFQQFFFLKSNFENFFQEMNLCTDPIYRQMVSLRFQRKTREILVSHFEFLTLELLFAQFGGMMSFWFGVSLFTLVSIFIKKYYRALFRFIYTGLGTKVFFLLFAGICFWQNLRIVKNYFNYETKTEIEFNSYSDNSMFPLLSLDIFSKRKKGFIELQNALTKDCNVNYINKTKFKTQNSTIVVQSHAYYIRPNFELRNVKSIEISIKEFIGDFSLEMLFQKTAFDILFRYFLQKAEKTRIDIGIKQTLFKRLELPFSTACYDYERNANQGNHGNQNWNDKFSGFGGCMQECFLTTSKKKYNCLENRFAEISEVEYKNEKLCDSCNFANYSDIRRELFHNCRKQCPDPCLDYQYEFWSREEKTKLIEINIVLDNRAPMIAFVSQPKMSFFDLFYECGGTVALWFDFSIICTVFAILNYKK